MVPAELRVKPQIIHPESVLASPMGFKNIESMFPFESNQIDIIEQRVDLESSEIMTR